MLPRKTVRALGAGALLWLTGGALADALEAPALRRAAEYSESHQGRALLVIQHGATLLERYAGGGGRSEPHKIYSGTKAFWIMAFLGAQEERLLDLDEKAADSLAEWRADPQRSQLTIRDLLDFTSGLDPVFHLHSDEVADRNRAALLAPIVAPRGERFIYGPAALQAAEEILRRKLTARRQTPEHYLETRVLAPLQLGKMRYKEDAMGNPLLASGFQLTAVQWGRFGSLALRKGAPLIHAESFKECLRGTAANPAFGLGLWNNHLASPAAREFDIEDMLELDWRKQDWRETCICRAAPPDLFAAIGSGYQRLFVIPSLDLVIVRMGDGGRFSDGEFLRLLLGSD